MRLFNRLVTPDSTSPIPTEFFEDIDMKRVHEIMSWDENGIPPHVARQLARLGLEKYIPEVTDETQ